MLDHHQFAVIASLGADELAGPKLRARLAEDGVKLSMSGFYRLLARMTDLGFLDAENRQERKSGVPVTVRYSKVTPSGAKAYDDTRRWYLERTNGNALGLEGTS